MEDEDINIETQTKKFSDLCVFTLVVWFCAETHWNVFATLWGNKPVFSYKLRK